MRFLIFAPPAPYFDPSLLTTFRQVYRSLQIDQLSFESSTVGTSISIPLSISTLAARYVLRAPCNKPQHTQTYYKRRKQTAWQQQIHVYTMPMHGTITFDQMSGARSVLL
jgi:hypothetical protein